MGNVSYLPKTGTPEWGDLARLYPTAIKEQLEVWRQQYNYANIKTFMDAMNKGRGIKRAMPEISSPQIIETSEPIINLPPIKLREYKPKKARRGDEEDAILHISDGHACKITPSYDEDVYNSRMETLFDATMTIVSLHRNMYPIRKLHIFNTGDNTQGENPHQGSNVGSVKRGARDQTIYVAYPAHVKLISSLKQEFEEVEVECVPGNHGHDRLAPETSREDLRLYDLLRIRFENTRGVRINIHERFSAIANVFDFRCFLFHGDGVPCQQGVPFFALDKKLKAWYMQYGGFNYAFGGHFHKRHSDEISSRLEYFMCGSLASDDEWALKKLGISSSPSQNIYGIHPQMGVTWRYGLVVDRKFLAEKLPDVYREAKNEAPKNI